MPAILVHVPVLNGGDKADQMSRIQQDLAAVQQQDKSNGIAAETEASTMLRRIMAKGRKPRVAVIGAGFAGLRATDVLVRHGVPVTIFEARNRVGGRVSFLFFG